MLTQILLIFHILFAIALITLVLVQKGKGAAMGAAFGSGASQTVFGSRGSGGFLVKLTIMFAILFFGTSIALTYIATRNTKPVANQSDAFLTQVEQLSKSVKDQNAPAKTQTLKPATQQPVSKKSQPKS